MHVAGGVTVAGGLLGLLAQVDVDRLLLRRHRDRVHAIIALRQLQAYVLSGLAINETAHDLAQFIHVFEAGGDHGFFDLAAGVQDVFGLELTEAIEEFLAIANADVLEGLRRDVRQHGVDF